MQKVFFLLLFIPMLIHAEFVSVNGTEIYVEKFGRGIPIVFIHGGPGLSHDYLRPNFDVLSVGNKLIYYDQRSSGRSSGKIDLKTITIDQYVEDLEVMRQVLGLNRIILLAHSWGGQLAMRYSIKYPHYVAALILIGSAPASSDGFHLFFNEYEKRTMLHKGILNRIKESKPYAEGNPETHEGYFRLLFSTYCKDPGDAKKLNLYFTKDSALNAKNVLRFLGKQLLTPHNLHPDLARIKAPTLILHGDYDPVPASEIMKIHEAIPGAQYIELPQSGHFPHVERQEETLNYISTFLSNLELVGKRE